MIDITKEELNELRILYKEEFNEEVSDEELANYATQLINLLQAVYKPIEKIDYEKINLESKK